MEKERFSKYYARVKQKKGSEQFFDTKKDPITTRKHDYLDRRPKGKDRYPPKTYQNDKSLVEMINEMRFRRHMENEETRGQNDDAFPMIDAANDNQPPNETPFGDEQMGDADRENVDVDPEQPEDPDRAGLIRKVEGAHLVYKRQASDGTYTELWVFHDESKLETEMSVKKAILAGTDIDPTTGKSEDGSQEYDVWTAGNAQMIEITGLPN